MTRRDACTSIADRNNRHAGVAKYNALHPALNRATAAKENIAPQHLHVYAPSRATVALKPTCTRDSAHVADGT
jgi:hypothetical protein